MSSRKLGNPARRWICETAPQIHPYLRLVRFTLRVDGYSLRAFDRACILRYCHREDAVLECRVHGAVIYISIERDLSLEAPIESFAVASIPSLSLKLLLSTHGE